MERKYTSQGWRQGTTECHYGVTLDLSKPTTGVINTNAPEWLHEECSNGIDLAWESHVEECAGACARCHCNHGGVVSEDDDESPPCDCYGRKTAHDYEPRDDHDCCGPQEQGTVLVGAWKKGESDEWEPDTDGEYSAIVGEIYTQVVWSKTVRKVRALCSPCFPGQADLDSGEGEYLAYDLPREVWGDAFPTD